MVNQYAYALIVGICLIIAFVLYYKWLTLYAKYNNTLILNIFKEGNFIPKKISPLESNLIRENIKELNWIVTFIYISLLIGGGFVLAFNISSM